MMSSLYIGATGLGTLSRGMQVVGNNLANVSTVGYKQSSAEYQDLFNSMVMAPANHVTNMSQLGHGSQFVAARTLFSMGGLESSNTVTDLAINGHGFFGVLKGDKILYTKAGNFRFDREGYLLDPTGCNLVGHRIVNGVPANGFEPIKISFAAGSTDSIYAARPTSAVSITTRLGGMENRSDHPDNPVFSMTAGWDGSRNLPLSSEQAGYYDALEVIDSAGNPQELRIYYDYVGMQNGVRLYEYLVGTAPGEDGSARAGTPGAGLLMCGTLSFDNRGELVGMTAFTPTGNNPAAADNWAPAAIRGGSPLIPVTFAGAAPQNISLNFGLSLNQGYNPALNSPAVGGSNPELFYSASPGATKTVYPSTAYGSSPYTTYLRQDGVREGYMSDLFINDTGFVTASYTNGEQRDLYQISLFRFVSNDGLRREGANHFSATDASGPADEGIPGSENFGGLQCFHIETSNVDMAREFTHMIITQRGFQANTKIITVSDAMLQRALELKR
ncbi:MAG: flagellar hook-basal body complex protein [Desulfovibrionaceae bacterium]|nr:flagellar hook-basal body complex protein [Desulfovibrionaceae bacterium]